MASPKTEDTSLPQTEEPNLSWSIPLTIDTEQDYYLNRNPVQENNSREEFFPREVIAEAIGSSRLQAELGRPILIGTFNKLPAFLLRMSFSFQHFSSSWFCRIKAADVTIVFEDASVVGKKAGQQKPPAVAKWHPSLYEGVASQVQVTNHVGASINLTYMGLGGGVNVAQSKQYVSFPPRFENC
jgi:hypothetical protein